MCVNDADLWNDEGTVGGNKLRTYRTFKINFGWEDYLSVVINRRHRIAMCRLRVSCHNLRIETGISADQRIFLYCNSAWNNGGRRETFYNRLQDRTGLQRYFVQSCFKRQPCFSRIIRTRDDVIFCSPPPTPTYNIRKLAWFSYIRMLFVQNVFYRHINPHLVLILVCHFLYVATD